jgi:hypothetical protein
MVLKEFVIVVEGRSLVVRVNLIIRISQIGRNEREII